MWRAWQRPPSRAVEEEPAINISVLVTIEKSDRHGLHFYYFFVTLSTRKPCPHQGVYRTAALLYSYHHHHHHPTSTLSTRALQRSKLS
mmetsp:Transcript_22686/g.53583  ORF Transcript_22686/g.53583 Transcript_22686/m.53583 type:complete len:88 (-) Transcript_22686:96-359(-)